MTIDLPQIHSGKVRELYDAGDNRLLMVASDRVSAFDVIMAEPIRHKGRVLTAMTAFWCREMSDVVPGTLLAADPKEIEAALPKIRLPSEWAGRAVLVQRAEMLQHHIQIAQRPQPPAQLAQNFPERPSMLTGKNRLEHIKNRLEPTGRHASIMNGRRIRLPNRLRHQPAQIRHEPISPLQQRKFILGPARHVGIVLRYLRIMYKY